MRSAEHKIDRKFILKCITVISLTRAWYTRGSAYGPVASFGVFDGEDFGFINLWERLSRLLVDDCLLDQIKFLSVRTSWIHVEGTQVQFLAFLTLNVDENKGFASHTGRFWCWERDLSTNWIEIWAPHRLLGFLEMRTTFLPAKHSPNTRSLENICSVEDSVWLLTPISSERFVILRSECSWSFVVCRCRAGRALFSWNALSSKTL